MTTRGNTSRNRDERIQRALLVAARLVALHGDDFLPHFESLEREFADIEGRQSAVKRAVTLANQSKAIFSSQRAL